MIAVVDYCKGNLRSVERGLCDAGGDARIMDDPKDIAQADAIVLPGVGAFGDASATMCTTGQMDVIRESIRAGKPFLGICLGEHLLFDEGTEGAKQGINPEGLGILRGIADRLPEYDQEGVRYKIPHVGWNSIEFNRGCSCPLLRGINPGEYFYFTHSYCAPQTDAVVATTTHSITFPCVVQQGPTVFGVQFHPEKSSDAGARVLKNFVEVVRHHKGY